MEKLEVLKATTKQSGNKKGDKDKSEDKTGRSKSKTKKFPKKSSKKRGGKRKRNGSDLEDDPHAVSTAQSIRPEEVPSGLATPKIVGS